ASEIVLTRADPLIPRSEFAGALRELVLAELEFGLEAGFAEAQLVLDPLHLGRALAEVLIDAAEPGLALVEALLAGDEELLLLGELLLACAQLGTEALDEVLVAHLALRRGEP